MIPCRLLSRKMVDQQHYQTSWKKYTIPCTQSKLSEICFIGSIVFALVKYLEISEKESCTLFCKKTKPLQTAKIEEKGLRARTTVLQRNCPREHLMK